MSFERIMTVDWDLTLGVETLTLKELERLAKLKAPPLGRTGRATDRGRHHLQEAQKTTPTELSLPEALRKLLGQQEQIATNTMPATPLICAECGGADIQCVSGDVIYPHRPDLYAKWYWRCACGAYVGCHRDTQEPMGTPAGPATRKARGEAHAAFDVLWKRKAARDGVSVKEARNAGYAWLARQMGLDVEDTHIARFTVAQCQRVVELCQPPSFSGSMRAQRPAVPAE